MALLIAVSCQHDPFRPVTGAKQTVHLSDLVGIWSDEKGDTVYRFTPKGVWYRYNEEGEVSAKGVISFDGAALTLTRDEAGKKIVLTVESADLLKENDTTFRRTDVRSTLAETERYAPFFAEWFENADLEGNVLSIEEADVWNYRDAEGETLSEGAFVVFSEEEDTPYLFTAEDEFYGTLRMEEGKLLLSRFVSGEDTVFTFAAEADSTVTYAYFKDKDIRINYKLGSGARLLRNGGAAYNDQRDYKRMSVNCAVEAKGLSVEDETATFDVVVRYTFRKSDLPAMTGRIYNTVRFSQYDFYSGELFTMEDSTGDDSTDCVWETRRDDRDYRIDCRFSSQWEYPRGEDVLVRWIGTYHLSMPVDYDGLILCLRPVFNSYSAQISSEAVLQEDTLALEDLGEDVQKCIFCRIRVEDIPAEDNAFNLDLPEVK